MSSLTSPFVRCLVWAGLSAAAALSLSGCHYTEEQKWAVCCVLYIIKDEAPSQSARATMIEWQAHTGFHGRGIAGDSTVSGRLGDTPKHRQIRLEIANFLAD